MPQNIVTVQALEQIRRDFAAQGLAVTFWPFFYALNFINLAGKAQDQQSFTNEAGAYFAVTHTHMTHIELALVPPAPVLPRAIVQIVSDVTGRPLNDRETHSNNLFGSAHRPFIWPWPWLVEPKQSVTLTLTSQSNDAGDFRAVFGGVKIFTAPMG